MFLVLSSLRALQDHITYLCSSVETGLEKELPQGHTGDRESSSTRPGMSTSK